MKTIDSDFDSLSIPQKTLEVIKSIPMMLSYFYGDVVSPLIEASRQNS